MCFLVYSLLGFLGTCGHPTFGFIGFLTWLAEKVNLVVFVSRTHTHTHTHKYIAYRAKHLVKMAFLPSFLNLFEKKKLLHFQVTGPTVD